MPQEARLKLYNNTMKVRIKSLGLPKAAYGQQVDYGLSLGRGMEGDPSGSLKPKRTIGGVPREEANLEAEGGETVVGQISGDGIVDHMIIKGPRHSSGGVPMNLPDDSFIFSDTASMKIKDPQILQMFGKSKGSYTPAELAKPYDISKYKAILMDPDTDRLSRNTAEIMIKNIVMKLGALALAQEAKKGFPQGIPEIAKPYMEANGITEEDLMPELKAQAEQMQAMQQQQAMQMQQAQGMQQPQGPPQGMPPMMPDGQPVAMPQQGMAPPQQPMMDPRQMMAMQQEQQMMPPQPQQGMPMAREGMSATNPNMSESCPQGQGWNGVLSKCQPIEELRMFYRNMNAGDPRRNAVLSELSKGRTNTDSYWHGLIDGDAWMDHFYHVGSQLSSEFGPDGYAYGKKRPKFSKEYTYPPKEQFGGTSMAAYGMQLGGYDMPFIMGTGGMATYHNGGTGPGHPHKKGTQTIITGFIASSFFMGTGGMMSYHNGGTGPGHPHGNETVDGREATKVETLPEDGTSTVTDQSGYDAKTIEERIAAEKAREAAAEVRGAGTTPSSGWEDSICDMIKSLKRGGFVHIWRAYKSNLFQ